MAIRHLPVVGRPTDPPALLRKIAIEEHFIDPAQVHPNYGDSFSSEDNQEGSSYGGFNPEFAEVVSARNDLRDGRIEEMDAAASTSGGPTPSEAWKGSPTRPSP